MYMCLLFIGSFVQMYMTCHTYIYIHHCNYTTDVDLHILIHVTTLLLVATMRIIYYKAVIRTKKSTTNPFKAIRIPLPKNLSANARQNLILGCFPTNKAYSGILGSCVRRVVLSKEKGSTLGISIMVGFLS